MKSVKLHFWGAAGCVTGSKYMLEFENRRLLVDCGMFQGLKSRRILNREPWPVAPSSLDSVLITHGHLDHVGMLPGLVRDGFSGPIFGTAPSLEVARIVMEDSAKIHMEEAQRALEEGYSKHDKPLPLYTLDDARAAARQFKAVPKDAWHTAEGGVRFRFRYNGHILGASFIELEVGGKRFVFSGDVGRPRDAILGPPERPERAEVLLLESTYGNRIHPDTDIESLLAGEIKGTIGERGACIIPSFAVERLQTVMYLLWKLLKTNRIPPLPIYVDSPMGENVLDLFERFQHWHKLPMEDYKGMRRQMEIITEYRDTWKAIEDPRPKVVVAGSGMLSGGRVLTYLSQLLDRETTRILLVGYQAEGTRGRNLLDGAHELKIFGKYIPVEARVVVLETLSAHADQGELLEWVSRIGDPPERIFLVHGEPTAQDAFRIKLRQEKGWKAVIPELFEAVEIPMGTS
ncbi:MAG: MBL fold metallo-hydrolase RNA specificity domain-containing protein [Robiginitalea sp.]|jgi:metallo-beta-lactamase family protein